MFLYSILKNYYLRFKDQSYLTHLEDKSLNR